MAIRNVIELDGEQEKELYINGKINIKGEEKVFDETGGTVYNTSKYAKDSIDLLNNHITQLLNPRYAVRKDRNIRLTLKQELDKLVEEHSELKDYSAIGFRIELRQGDTIPINITSSSYEYCYLNGVERTANYTYEGDDVEYAILFYLGKDVLNLNDVCTLNTIDGLIYPVSGTINYDKSWVSFINSVDNYDDFNLNADNSVVRHYTEYKVGVRAKSFPLRVKSVYTEATNFSGAMLNANNQPDIQELNAPNIEVWSMNSGIGIATNSSNFVINMPKLKTMYMAGGGGNAYLLNGIQGFKFSKYLESMSHYVIRNIKSYLDFSEVEGYVTIDTNWYAGTGPSSLLMTQGWKSTINLSKAGSKQTKDWYLDLFDKLATVEETQTLTIPSTIYSALTDDEKLVATNKNWTLGGA